MVFRSAEYQITFIEQNEDLCEKLEKRYNVPIFQGDATKQEILEQVELQKMNVAIAATNNDERNSIVALQLRRLGVKKVIAIARDPDYVSLLEESGIVCISAPYATSAMVENYLDRPIMADLFQIEGGVANLIDVEVPDNGVQLLIWKSRILTYRNSVWLPQLSGMMNLSHPGEKPGF